MKDNLPEEFSFGAWLRQRRRSLDLTQQKLADQVGCARITLRRIEADALKPSRELAQILLEKLGVPESERVEWVRFARGLSNSPQKSIQETVPLPSPTNLPVALTSFIGREKEQNEVIHLLVKNRLVTLLGAGGIGKTRLALQVGQELLNDYSNGVWFVALDSLSDPALIPQTVASVFDLRESCDRPIIEILTNVLREKTTLLILDNCEHLLEACTQLITTLLQNCLNLKILVTSREILNMQGEAVYSLPSLSIPKNHASLEDLTQYESVQLFRQRAALALSSFRLTKVNAQIIIDICRKVDGIPLAIELAAAYIDILHPKEILKQLNESISLLSTDSRVILPRHQTMRASIDWSWSLLSEQEQIFLRQLSVFAGGWTLESAQSVCGGNTLSLISTLVKKSLIIVDQKSEGETRYHFHEIVRQYMSEKMLASGEEKKIRTRHLQYFLQLSEQAEKALRGPTQVEWMSRLNDERANIRTALEWADRTDLEAGLYLLGRLYRFWEGFDLREAAHWLAKLIEHPESKVYPHARARALFTQGRLLTWFEQFPQARSATQASLDLFRVCGDGQGEIDSLLSLGYLSDSTENVKYSEQALALAKSLGDTWRQAEALYQLTWMHSGDKQLAYLEQAIILFRQCGDWGRLVLALSKFGNSMMLNGDLALAQQGLDEALHLSNQLNDKDAKSVLLSTLGRMVMIQGDYGLASRYLQEALDLWEEVGSRMQVLWSRTFLGYLALCKGNFTEARSIFTKTAREFFNDKSEIGVAFTLEGLAGLFIAVNRSERAAQLIGWADAMREKITDPRPPLEQADVAKIITACMAEMGEAAFSDAYDEGQKMTLDEAVAYALKEE